MNKKNTTKARPCASGTRIARLFKVLTVVAAVKLVLAAALVLELLPGLPGPSQWATAQAASKPEPKAPEPPKAAQAEAPRPEAPQAQQSPAPQAEPAAEPTTTPDQDALRRKAEDLARREQALRDLERELDAKLQRVTQLESSIKQLIADAESRKDEKLRHLIDVYANMKAKQAAEALEKIQEDTAVKILAGMKGRQAGEIMSSMRAEKAAVLSEALSRMISPQAAAALAGK